MNAPFKRILTIDFETRFWARVRKRYERDGCWEWTGACFHTGYGMVKVGRKVFGTHRVAAFLIGMVQHLEAPLDKRSTGFVLHRCDNKRCCNPAHLRVGTYRENQKEAYERGLRQPVHGFSHHEARHTPASLRVVFEMAADEIPQTTIAALMGISQTSVWRVLHGKSYGRSI